MLRKNSLLNNNDHKVVIVLIVVLSTASQKKLQDVRKSQKFQVSFCTVPKQ